MAMRVTEFDQLMSDEFGGVEARWIAHSHVLSTLGDTPDGLIDAGVNPREVWEEICRDFEVPEGRRLGVDRPGS